MWGWLLSREQQRRRLLRTLPEGPLRDYYRVPFAQGRAPLASLELVALDLETTGFDPAKDAILSIGRVQLRNGQVELGSAHHTVVQAERAIGEVSAVVHGITDDRAAAGVPLVGALSELLPALAGRVLVAHHARLERGFLDAACRRLWGGPFLIPIVDTLYLARRSLARRQQSVPANALRLHNLREHYGLPRYPAHNALSDALATAELLLVQLAHAGDSHRLRLNDILLPRRS